MIWLIWCLNHYLVSQGEIGPGDTAEQIKKRAEQYNAFTYLNGTYNGKY